MKDTRFLQLQAASNAGISSLDHPSMASTEWLSKLDKRTADRSPDDISQILAGLQNFQPLQRLHPSLLRHMSQYAFCEAVEKNVTLFREGDITKNWYAVVEGRLRVIKGGQNYVIGKGAVFEEITSYDNKRKLTVVTKEFCNLIRLERKQMKLFCKSHPYQLKDVLATTVLELDQIERPSDIDGDLDTALAPPPRITVNSHSDQHNGGGDASLPDSSGLDNGQTESGLDPVLLDLEGVKPRSPPISETQSSLLLTSIIDSFPDFVHPQLGRKHCISAEHLMTYVADVTQAQSLKETLGICQVLLEDAVIKPLDRKTPITDFQTAPTFVYFFPNVSPQDSIDEDELQSLLDDLIRHGGDALLRMTLRKAPELRTEEDLDFIYNELLHIKALAHLSTMIKRELAKVVLLESHSNAGTVLFNQGDEGTSWYIILKGSVNVVIYGKGVVCSLHEGDDFGKLALVNDAPRAASIILREPCHFLRVDKNDFNRILRDVEANTVRLKEHGTDVLILEKIGGSNRGSKDKNHRYSVMAGTAEKVLEYMLDSRLDDTHQDPNDFLLEDYLLTYPLFISTDDLCSTLMRYYNSKIRQTTDGESAKNRSLLNRKHVVAFIRCWFEVDNDVMFQKAGVRDFLKTLADAVYHDAGQFDLKEQHMTMEEIMDACEKYFEELQSAQSQRQLNVSTDSNKSDDLSRPVRPTDETIVKVYNGLDISSYTAVRVSADTRTSVVLKLAAKKLQVEGPVVLAEIKSNGEYNLYKDEEMSIETKLSVNGRLFCCTKEQLAHLNPLPEQQGPNEGSGRILETISSKELAYHSTMYDWALFRNVHESELLHHIMGRQSGITSNLDRLMLRFNQIHHWVSTEICLTASQTKRGHMLKKFIKAAGHCKEYHNLFGFCAIIMGLTNSAITRLVQSWDKVPSKLRKTFHDYEALMDPGRNHRSSRMLLHNLHPPIIPFMPLIMKDLTFTHEGNKTHFENLVNFEKMHMVADTLRLIRYCKSTDLNLPLPPVEKPSEFNIAAYVRSLRVIDNQRRLMQLSFKREQKKFEKNAKPEAAGTAAPAVDTK